MKLKQNKKKEKKKHNFKEKLRVPGEFARRHATYRSDVACLISRVQITIIIRRQNTRNISQTDKGAFGNKHIFSKAKIHIQECRL